MIGEIKEGLFLTEYVGKDKGNVKGKEVEFELLVGAVNKAPIIHYGRKKFVLGWDDIVNLAEDAGLFEDDEESEVK